VAAGNDALASHSEMRKSAKLMLQFIPGADFVTSGYGSIPRYDNMFGGGNFDATELDDWYVIQRDMQVDGGIHPLTEPDILRVRERAARAVQAVFDAFDFASISEVEVQSAITAFTSEDMPDRDRVADIKAAQMLLNGPITVLEVIKALAEAGYHDAASNLLEMQRQRVIGDYLQPAGIFAAGFHVLSALTDPNDYAGPGTGYRVEGERWEQLQNIPQAWNPREWRMANGEWANERMGESANERMGEPAHPKSKIQNLKSGWLEDVGLARIGTDTEVVIAIGPAFGTAIQETISGLDLRDVLGAMLAGIAEEGAPARIVRVHHTSDCAFIGHAGAQLSGSGVAIGIQSKGTTVIHQRDLAPLENLELFSMAPNMTLETYRQIGRNAARYAQRKPTSPAPVKIDNTARLRLIVQTTLLHHCETEMVEDRPPAELRFCD